MTVEEAVHWLGDRVSIFRQDGMRAVGIRPQVAIGFSENDTKKAGVIPLIKKNCNQLIEMDIDAALILMEHFDTYPPAVTIDIE